MRSTVIGFPPYHVFSSEKLEDTTNDFGAAMLVTKTTINTLDTQLIFIVQEYISKRSLRDFPHSNEAGENEDVYQVLYYFRSSNAKQWLYSSQIWNLSCNKDGQTLGTMKHP
ncbi:hypothetical protein F2Q69_00024300 [Brassica cretica]|uniref:Uncharacterized protein n=1 Tax=Brassica cretica TaxID=69181 RepID=A0A8S9QIE7_BRACR|nr:hypothetical protein F2Q69_00024300 [Brassica cretica]